MHWYVSFALSTSCPFHLSLKSDTLQESDTCRLSGAVSLCNPFNLVIADEDFHKGFNNVYDKALSYALYYDCSYTWSSVYCSPMMMSMMMEALIQLTLHSH